MPALTLAVLGALSWLAAASVVARVRKGEILRFWGRTRGVVRFADRPLLAFVSLLGWLGTFGLATAFVAVCAVSVPRPLWSLVPGLFGPLVAFVMCARRRSRWWLLLVSLAIAPFLVFARTPVPAVDARAAWICAWVGAALAVATLPLQLWVGLRD